MKSVSALPRIEHLTYHVRDDNGDGSGDHCIYHDARLFAVKHKGRAIWRTWHGRTWLREQCESLVEAFDALQAAAGRRT